MIVTPVFVANLGSQTPNPVGSEKGQGANKIGAETRASENPNAVAVVARGVGVVPGAIVCPDFATFKLMFSLYTESWSENASNVMTKGLSGEVNGPPIPSPDFRRHGCALLPRGTPMRLQSNNGAWSVVTAKLPSGKTIRGITLPSMTDYPPEVRQKQLELRQAEGMRYDEIMQAETERHAAAVRQESDRHLAIMRQLNPLYNAASQGSSVECIAENCQPEMQRHAAAVQQENALFLSRGEAARKQAAQSQPPGSLD
jgi:hypothetical protein